MHDCGQYWFAYEQCCRTLGLFCLLPCYSCYVVLSAGLLCFLGSHYTQSPRENFSCLCVCVCVLCLCVCVCCVCVCLCACLCVCVCVRVCVCALEIVSHTHTHTHPHTQVSQLAK